jgi:hypothetical protein
MYSYLPTTISIDRALRVGMGIEDSSLHADKVSIERWKSVARITSIG